MHSSTLLRLTTTAAVAGILLTGAWAHAELVDESAPPFSLITYRGYLEHEGEAVNEPIDLSIDLFDAASGGTRLTASPMTFEDIEVSDGEFAVELTLDEEMLGRPAVWLAVSIDAGDGLVALDGRQRLTSTPYAQLAGSAADGNPPGTVLAFAGAAAPHGFLLCDGSEVSREDYASLFETIGTTWGAGDDATTFNLPDLRGRTPIGAGQGTGLTNRELAQLLGEETHTLTIAEMPSHSHGITTVPPADWGGGYSGGGWFGDPAPFETAAAGGGQSHNVLQPSAVMTFIIKY